LISIFIVAPPCYVLFKPLTKYGEPGFYFRVVFSETRRIRSGTARTASGHAAAAPPSSVMKLRRFI
jgi:hypothetical protein